MEFKGTKDLAFYKANAEENYITTPISVLKYISELEKQKAPEMLEMLKVILEGKCDIPEWKKEMAFKLIKEATEINP
jgi:hypothetical protein